METRCGLCHDNLLARNRMFGPHLPKILVVDDQTATLAFLKKSLIPLAADVAEAPDAPSALEAIEGGNFDIVLSSIHLPGGSGLELLAMAHQSQWDVSFILMAERTTVEEAIAALRLQACDFLLKPFSEEILSQAVERSFQRLLAQRSARAYCSSLEASILRRTRNLEVALRDVESNYQNTLEALVVALDTREHETYAHSFRVRAYTIHLACLVSYTPALLPQLENSSLLHDIGKIAISDAILLKPGRLTEEEWVEMKKHPVVGEEMLRRVSFLEPAALIVRHHHEKFDGSGYPDGLAGDQIPLGSRLFAFADTLDAITSDRPYRKAPGYSAMKEEVRRCSGTQFDPRIAEIFLQVPEQTWRKIRAGAEQQYFRPAVQAIVC